MKNNILSFTASREIHPAAKSRAYRDNIVSLDKWRNRARPHRTSTGVFFMTNVLCTPGAAA